MFTKAEGPKLPIDRYPLLFNEKSKISRLVLTILYKTRPKGSEIDGVGIVAILQKPSGPELLLQKQFRPPINKVVIEVPAGLVDAGESAAQSAVRELREETGYHGEVSEISPVMFNGQPHIYQTLQCHHD